MGADKHYLHYDHIGNLVQTVNGSGQVTGDLFYTPFGEPIGGNIHKIDHNQPFGFSTKRGDFASGLLYFGYRFYVPHMERWLNRDPIGINGGLNGGINTYLYANANPLKFIDPLGLCPCGNPQDAIDNARNDKRDWSQSADRTDVNSGFGSGTYKCNLFADTSLESAGFNLPNVGGSWLSSLLGRYPPGAQGLSDPNYEVSGWPVVSGPAQLGDLVAEGGHVGISTGSGNSISAAPWGVVENDWGSRSGQSPVVRRCSCN